MPKGQKGLLTSKTVLSYCWWFRNPAFTSWGEGSLSHHLQGFIHPRWLAGFLSSTASAFTLNRFLCQAFHVLRRNELLQRLAGRDVPRSPSKEDIPHKYPLRVLLWGCLLRGPHFSRVFPPFSLWKENVHLSATSMAACASSGALLGLTVRYTATSIPTTSSITEPFVFLGGSVCLSVKTSSSTNLFQSSTPVFVCKKYIYIYLHKSCQGLKLHPSNWDFRQYFSTARWPCDWIPQA